MNQLSLRRAGQRSSLLAYILIALCLILTPAQARTLNLTKQKIKNVTKIKVKEGITKLKLQRNKIRNIAPLQLPSTLKELNISNNKITDLKDLQLNSNLEALTAYSNEITTVNGLVLPDKLQFLSLSLNDIEDVHTLNLPPDLEELRLSQASLTDASINGLVLNENLDSLNLVLNNITTLRGIQFNDKIKDLAIGANDFREIDWSLIPQSVEILTLVGNNSVTNYEEMILPPNLKVLYFSVIFFDNPSFMNGKLPDSLTLLHLRRNFISSLDGFEFPPNLEELDLEHNSLNDFDYELPESMMLLDLRDNLISKRTRREIRARYRDMSNLKIKF